MARRVHGARDLRADVYAVGCLAYYLLSGREVFEGRNSAEIIGHQLHSVPVPLRVRVGETVPPTLDELVMRCLSKKASERPHSRELRSVLRKLAVEHSWTELQAESRWRTHQATLDAARDGKPSESVSRSQQVTAVARASRPAA